MNRVPADVLEPLLVTLESEASAFFCYSKLMKVRPNSSKRASADACFYVAVPLIIILFCCCCCSDMRPSLTACRSGASRAAWPICVCCSSFWSRSCTFTSKPKSVARALTVVSFSLTEEEEEEEEEEGEGGGGGGGGVVHENQPFLPFSPPPFFFFFPPGCRSLVLLLPMVSAGL